MGVMPGQPIQFTNDGVYYQAVIPPGVFPGMQFRTRVRRRKLAKKKLKSAAARRAAARSKRRKLESFAEVAGIARYVMVANRAFHRCLSRSRSGSQRKIENITVGYDKEKVAAYRAWLEKSRKAKDGADGGNGLIRRRLSGDGTVHFLDMDAHEIERKRRTVGGWLKRRFGDDEEEEKLLAEREARGKIAWVRCFGPGGVMELQEAGKGFESANEPGFFGGKGVKSVDSRSAKERKAALNEVYAMAGRPFPEKLKWFKEKIKAIRGGPKERVDFHVRREDVVNSSNSSYHRLKDDVEKMRQKWKIKFEGEEGIDQGGVTKDWLELMARQLFRPEYGLFKVSEVDDATYRINPDSGLVQPNHLQYFAFFGALLARVLLWEQNMPAHLSRTIYKHILALPLVFDDLEFVDEALHRSLKQIREMDPDDVEDICLDFSVTREGPFGEVKVVPLKDGGLDEELTGENRDEFILLNVKHVVYDAVEPQLKALLQGFYAVLPLEFVSVFDFQELELVISGMPEIDVDDWERNTVYCSFYNVNHPVIKWFWETVRTFSHEQRARLLQFVTGTARVPIEGFKHLQSDGGVVKPFKIMPVRREMCMYPRAHTCFNSVELPVYEDKMELRECLEMVICMQATDKLGFVDK
jgi:hypothetical protein